MRLTLNNIKKLQQEGKIQGYTVINPCKPKEANTRKPKRSKEKEWMTKNLWHWCKEKGLEMQTEQRFHEKRKWRFDWSIPSLKIAIEYNGIMSAKSRHTTVTGYTGDMEKLNAAQSLGWKVLQFTPLNYKDLITELNKHLT